MYTKEYINDTPLVWWDFKFIANVSFTQFTNLHINHSVLKKNDLGMLLENVVKLIFANLDYLVQSKNSEVIQGNVTS